MTKMVAKEGARLRTALLALGWCLIALAFPATGSALPVDESLWVPDSSGEPQVSVERTDTIPNLYGSFKCIPSVFEVPPNTGGPDCALYGSGNFQGHLAGKLMISGLAAPWSYTSGGLANVWLLPDGAFAHFTCDGGFGCFASIDPQMPAYRWNISRQRYEWRFTPSTEPRVSAEGVDLRVYPYSTATSRTGRYLVAVTPQHIVRIDRASGEVRQVSSTPSPGLGFSLDTPLAISPSGRYVAVGSRSWGTSLRVFDMDTCSTEPQAFTSTCSSADLGDLFKGPEGSFQPGNVGRVVFYGESKISFAARTSVLPDGSDSEYRQFLMTAAGGAAAPQSATFLGDSFTSGEGVQAFSDDPSGGEEYVYRDGTDVYTNCEWVGLARWCDPLNICHVSAQAWPDRAAGALGLASFSTFACSGARSYNLTQITQYPDGQASPPGFPGSEPQFASLGRLSPTPGRIYVQIGGNDAGFANIIEECIQLGDCSSDLGRRREVALGIQDSFKPVSNGLAALRDGYDGDSDIYLVGYPAIVDPDNPGDLCGANVHLDGDERLYADQISAYIDQVSAAAADRAGVGYISLRDSIASHQLCDNVPWVNGLTKGNDILVKGFRIGAAESYHPRREAHAAFAAQVVAQTKPQGSGNPAAQPDVAAPSVPDWAAGNGTSLNWLPNLDSSDVLGISRVGASGLTPGSEVSGYFQSDPVAMAPVTVDNDGNATFTPQPSSPLPAGLHTLNLFATRADGVDLHARIPVLVPSDDGDTDADGILDDVDGCPLIPFNDPGSDGDVDGDGTSDGCDASLTDGPSADPDGDGLTNLEEDTAGTDRYRPDSDDDGIPDGEDNCGLAPNLDQRDLDGDGAGDPCDPDRDGDEIDDTADNCAAVPNPDQRDVDGDGAGDACDPDRDGDDIDDHADNCRDSPNPGQADQDGDGLGDVCDADRDGDDVPDESDNCVETPNPGQQDLDFDGFGDACDPDRDGDVVDDNVDNCPDVPNPGQGDSDKDGAGDACDTDLPPAQKISDLIDTIDALGIAEGTKRSLLAKLRGVQAAYNRRNTEAGCGKLTAFTNEVSAQSGKKIPAGTADGLLDDSDAIHAAIGC